VGIGSLALMLLVYMIDLYTHSGREAPVGFFAYIGWLTGQQLEPLFQLLQPVVNFIGIVIVIIILAYALGSQ
jgi:uncharacterized membrane protein